MANLFPSNDNDFSNGLGNFITVANANLATLGLTAGDITAATDAKSDLDTTISGTTAAREASKSATAAEATSRKSADGVLRGLVKKVEATPDMPVALITELGMSVRDGKPTPIEPSVPVGLFAYGFDDGVNQLKWDRNGNKAGTTYVVEAMIGIGATTFHFIGNSTKTTFKHKGQIPGQKVTYRVKATRPAGESEYSNEAVVYNQALPLAA